MICKNCGSEVSGAYCEYCGARVEQNGEEQQQIYRDPYVDNGYQTTEQIVDAQPSQPEKDPGKGLGIAALVLGIFAILFGTICSCLAACLGGFLPLVCGIAGIVLGAIGYKKSKAAGFSNKLALIGMIISIVAVVLIVIFIALNGILGGLSAIVNNSASVNEF